MIDILKYIDEMQVMYGDKEPSSMDQEPRNMYNQGSSVDHAVRTIDPVQDSGNKIEEVLKAYGRYRGSRKGKRPMKFKNFFELYSTENFAAGGSAGQLVQPNDDGSRPGYQGDDVASEIPEIYDDELLKKRISIGRSTGPTSQAVTVGEIFERVKNVKGGPELITDFKKNPTESKFLVLRKKYKNRVKTERIQNLSEKEKVKFRQKVITSERKWRASEKGRAYYNKLNATQGIFPGETPQERVWRDIYRAANQKKTTSRFQIKYPKNIEINPATGKPVAIKSAKGNMYIPWEKYYKQISFYDTKTKSTIKFGNMREWMKNNIKGGGKKYDNSIVNYKIRQNISDFTIGDQSLGDIYKKQSDNPRKVSPSAVNHRSGLDNFWDTEITTSTGNNQLNDKVQSKMSALKNAPNAVAKDKILKKMNAEINKIKGGATLVVDGKTIGKPPTLRKVSNALSKELNVDLLKLAGTANKKCKGLLSYGGRVGLSEGLSPEFCINEGKKVAQKALFQEGATPAQKSIARRLISSGGKIAISMLNPKELIKLKNLVGPGALGLMAAYEVGSITDDVLRLNKPLDEALAGNWLTKSFLPYSEEFAKQKNLLQSGASMSNSQKKYALEMMKIEKAIKEDQRIQNMESTQVVDGAFDDNFIINPQEKIDAAKEKFTKQVSGIKESSFVEGSARQLENKALMDDYEDAQKARTGASTIFGGPQRLVNTAPRPKNMGRGPMTEKKRMNLDFSIPGITPYNKTYTPSDKEISDYYQTLEKPRPLNPGEATEIRMGMGGEGLYGTQGKFAGGGIAGLSGGDKSGRPPESGPASQGLRSLFNNGKKR